MSLSNCKLCPRARVYMIGIRAKKGLLDNKSLNKSPQLRFINYKNNCVNIQKIYLCN